MPKRDMRFRVSSGKIALPQRAALEPAFAHGLRYILVRVQLGSEGRTAHGSDVVGHNHVSLPSRPIEQQGNESALARRRRRSLQAHVHRLVVAVGHGNAGAATAGRAGNIENPGESPTLILGC